MTTFAEWFFALKEQFDVLPERGVLIRKWSKQRPDLVGTEAGYVDNCGYVRVAFAGRKYLRSHLMFALAHGRMPQGQIDHINRIRTDDRPENLREVTHHQNMWNRTPMRRDLPMGVTFRDGRYEAAVMCNGKRHRLGRFDTVEAAHTAYETKRKEFFSEYA